MRSPHNRMLHSNERPKIRRSSPRIEESGDVVCANAKCRKPRTPGKVCHACGTAAVVYRPQPGVKY